MSERLERISLRDGDDELLPGDYDDAAPAPGYLSVHCSPRISSPARVQVLESSIANPPSKPGSPSASTYFLNAFPAWFFFFFLFPRVDINVDFSIRFRCTRRLSFSTNDKFDVAMKISQIFAARECFLVLKSRDIRHIDEIFKSRDLNG